MARVDAQLLQKHFGDWEHPYRRFERAIETEIEDGATILDVGCGRAAPVLQKFRGRCRRLIGIDCIDFVDEIAGVELYKRDLISTGLDDESVDLIMARSVLEHVLEPEVAFKEMNRLLKPGGRFVFLTANRWDYASLVATLIPNQFHPWIVRNTEGREEADVFPTAYRANTKSQVKRLADMSGLTVRHFEYLGQYPNYLMFSRTLFRMGAAYEKFLARTPALHMLRGWIFATLEKPRA
jgi:SAM-dependent methyltransferase